MHLFAHPMLVALTVILFMEMGVMVLRWTKETSQYRRSTSNYGTCKERLICYMIIMHMSPYDTYGSM